MRADRQNTNVHVHFCSENNGQPGHPPGGCSAAVAVVSDWTPLHWQSAQRSQMKSPPCCYRLPELCRAVTYNLLLYLRKYPPFASKRGQHTPNIQQPFLPMSGEQNRGVFVSKDSCMSCVSSWVYTRWSAALAVQTRFIVLSSVQFNIRNVVYHGTWFRYVVYCGKPIFLLRGKSKILTEYPFGHEETPDMKPHHICLHSTQKCTHCIHSCTVRVLVWITPLWCIW